MRWRGRRVSTNVEDRRGSGGGMRPMMVKGPVGCGIMLVVGLIFVWMGGDPIQLLRMLEQTSSSLPDAGQPLPSPGAPGAASDELSQFAGTVLADTEETWAALLGGQYREPTLVLFSGATSSACGYGSAAVGPFYCPADGKVYIDLSFFGDLERRFGAPGDFAQAYVIAHEIGHHVQNLLGISGQVHDAQQRLSREEGNALSVRLELQADCLAGVWAHHAHRERQLLEPGDVEEGLRAAAAIGDDAIQRGTTGQVRPESWTHGSSEQRVSWLRRGMESGDPNDCDTFAE